MNKIKYILGNFMKTNKSWDVIYSEFQKQLEDYKTADFTEIKKNSNEKMESLEQGDIRWLTQALNNSEKKWFLSYVVNNTDYLPEHLFIPLLQAAIYEINPDANKEFVQPCMKFFGPRKVNEYLLDVVQNHPDPFEQAGAVNALYWAQVTLTFKSITKNSKFTFDEATKESQEQFLRLKDVWHRKMLLFLETFVTNEDLDVRRSLIPSLDLNIMHYPDSYKKLVKTAIKIAKKHPDDYIKHRVKVQLGKEKMLKAIPYRKPKKQAG